MANASTPPTPSPLQTIPLEVLLRITHFITTPELGNLRLTCRSIERSLDTTFLHEFFFRKQFMLSDDSLQALIDISKSRLGPSLRQVYFGLEHYPDSPRLYGISDGHYQRFGRLVARHAGMFTLWSTGHHREMLSEAFRNLKNLEHVVIRSFNSAGRLRDGPNAAWTSYGSTTASQELGYSVDQGTKSDWRSFDSGHPFCNQVFAAVIAALGYAGAKPKGIEVMAKGRPQLKDYAFNIPPYLEPTVLPMISQLETLRFDLDRTWTSGYGPENSIAVPEADFMLRKFLFHATNVKHLRINSFNYDFITDSGLFDWLASPTTPIVDPSLSEAQKLPGPSFPHLEEINLGRMKIDASRLLRVMSKFAPSLKDFELTNITFQRPLPVNHNGRNPKISFWSDFLKKLRDIPGLNLHHIGLRFLQQSWCDGNNDKCRVSFNGEPNMAYTGPDWKHFVGETIPRIEVDHSKEDIRWNETHGQADVDDDDDDDGIWEQYALDL
ncbi:hypothetical protein BGZ63DRAFT_356284 [Mariannaea sp. PMI_226]|nr:hypothetical protein BGZ63DRAFT_356284 [Mariannaea sp. PMI_226]